jgi:hypothetical protein
LHFFDLHFIEEIAARRANTLAIRNECALAVRLALLAAGEVYVPAASYFESALCRSVIDEFAPLFDRGCLWLVGSGSGSDEFAELKLAQYPRGSVQADAYEAVRNSTSLHPPFRTRHRSATEDLKEFWLATLDAPDFPTGVFGRDAALPSDFEDAWAAVPERIERSAFIVDHVEPLLLPTGSNLIVRNRLHGVINEGYFESHAQELEAGLVVDLTHLASGHALRSGNVDLPYRQVREGLRAREVLADVVRAPAAALIDLRQDPRVAQTLLEAQLDRVGPDAYGAIAIQLQLTDPPDLAHLLRAVLRVVPGRRGATAYHRAVAAFLTTVFQLSLADPRIEESINEGRKRIDVLFRNVARDGFFRRIATHALFGGTPNIICECKNYTDDVKNPEIDQLTGRFAPTRGRVGILLCRRIRDRAAVTARCRDAGLEGRGWVIALDDADLTLLAEHGLDPRWTAGQSQMLSSRMDDLTRP